MGDPVGVEFKIKGRTAVERFLSRTDKRARDIEARANAARSSVNRASRQLGQTGFTAVGGQLIAFASSEVIGQLVNQQTDSKLFAFASSVGTAAATGFFTSGGNPFIAGASALTAAISQISGLLRSAAAERERLKAEIEAQKKRVEAIREKTEASIEANRRKLEEAIVKIQEQSKEDAFELAYQGWLYAGAR